MTRRTLSQVRRRWWARFAPDERKAHVAKCIAGRVAAAAERERLKRAWLAKLDIALRHSAGARDAP